MSDFPCKIIEEITSQFEDIKEDITKEVDRQILKGFELLNKTAGEQIKEIL